MLHLAVVIKFITLHTTKGDIVIELFPNHAPKTVANFVELAAGMREWVNPNTGTKTNQPLYDGTIFHRVIAGFMIQGGDPLGTGTGGPGYKLQMNSIQNLPLASLTYLQWQMPVQIQTVHNSLLLLQKPVG